MSLGLAGGLIFFIISLTPGEIQEIHHLSDQTVKDLHLDQPALLQFFYWILGILTLNFGVSLTNGTPVLELLFDYTPITLYLTFGSLFITLLLSVPIAIYLSQPGQTKLKEVISTFVYSFSSIPVFVVGYIILAFVFNFLHFYPLDPPSAHSPWWHWWMFHFLPMIVLGLGNGTLGEFVRILKLEIENVNQSLYIKSARARGVSLLKHFFRPVFLPFLSVIISRIAVLLGGVIVVERIFNRHGLGWLTWEATLNRDFFVIMAVSFFTVFVVRIFMLIQDLLKLQLDPRQRT